MNEILKFLNKSAVRSKIYAGIILIALLLTVFLFARTLVFLGKSIRLAGFSADDEALPASVFDFQKFAPLAGRMNVNLEPASQPAPEPVQTATSSEPAATSTEPAPTLPDLGAVKVQILNATRKSGLAKAWQDKFSAGGFKEATAGNYAGEEISGARINYKPEAKNILSRAKEILIKGGIDSGVVVEKESAEQSFDLIIIIGK